MAKPKGGLTAWFGKGPKGDWVDISAPKKKGKFQACGRKSAKGGSKRGYPKCCLLYTSPSPRDGLLSRMPSSA